MIKNSIQGIKITFNLPSRLYANDGTTLKVLQYSETPTATTKTYSIQQTPANGDRFQIFFVCDGTETKLELGNRKDVDCGIFDLYVNGVLDSSGYDDYIAVLEEVYREITLTQPIKKGLNTIELRVNSKNVASSNYKLKIWGASIQ